MLRGHGNGAPARAVPGSMPAPGSDAPIPNMAASAIAAESASATPARPGVAGLSWAAGVRQHQKHLQGFHPQRCCCCHAVFIFSRPHQGDTVHDCIPVIQRIFEAVQILNGITQEEASDLQKQKLLR